MYLCCNFDVSYDVLWRRRFWVVFRLNCAISFAEGNVGFRQSRWEVRASRCRIDVEWQSRDMVSRNSGEERCGLRRSLFPIWGMRLFDLFFVLRKGEGKKKT